MVAVPISVEKFVAHDLEVILGVKYDATFGPVLLCGLGGIFTEVLKDFTLRLAPLVKSDATEMLAALKALDEKGLPAAQPATVEVYRPFKPAIKGTRTEED